MSRERWAPAALTIAALMLFAGVSSRLAGQTPTDTANRVARLSRELQTGTRTLTGDARTGYLRALLAALGISEDTQLLVFSKTGVQRAYTGPRTPRALYFDESAAVGYVPGAPELEIVTHDPVEGLAFYTVDQHAVAPVPVKRTSCLTCHETGGTHDVPSFIVRSHAVDEAGNLLPQPPSHDVDHRTGHPDRWGGWLVTSEGEPPPYNQRAHEGNITFTRQGNTSNQVFIEWIGSAPESRGYLTGGSDIMALLAFDHQMPAINRMTRLDFLARRVAGEGASTASHPEVLTQANELADYLLFDDEAALAAPLTATDGFARSLAARVPKDPQGRSLAQLDGVSRLLRYGCSYMVYSEPFAALPGEVRQLVYRRMIERLSNATGDRRAALDILRATKTDFPRE